MSFSVSIHSPKTPITAGSGGEAKATLPNVCKMPGPPAPFIPSPLPNIAKSSKSPDGYSTSVKIEGEAVAIRGATFQSMGDEASKGTGGGLISANTGGIAKFILPGAMDVKIEGKGVHLKGDQVLNNCASGGTPPNTGATMAGTKNPDGKNAAKEIAPDCGKKKKKKSKKWDDCMCGQVCEMVKAYNDSQDQKKVVSPSPSNDNRPGSRAKLKYDASLRDFRSQFAALVAKHSPDLDHPEIKAMFYNPGPPAPPDCQHEKWKNAGGNPDPSADGPAGMNPDHMHPASLSGPLTAANCIWASARVNRTVGGSMGKFKKNAPAKMKAHPSCNCD
jgi:hypothetical protein